MGLNSDGTYTVEKSDTLSGIAAANGTTVAKLVELNNITDPDYIVVGQVLKLSGTATKETNTSNKAIIKAFGIQTGTERTLYATWTWTKSYTENYKVMWYYATGDGVWFVANDGGSTVESKQATYNAPENATKVKFKVKPISKKKKTDNKETSYWTAEWSTEKICNVSEETPPTTPAVPTVELDNLKLTATLDNLDVNATYIQFQIIRDNSKTYKTVKVEIKKNYASYSCSVASGSEYKVRARSIKGDEYSDWSEYSDNYGTPPSTPKKIKSIKQLTKNSISIDWTTVKTADTYELQYTIKKTYFDSNPDAVQTKTYDATDYPPPVIIEGLELGYEYFFRVRALRDESDGVSGWTDIRSFTLGSKPSAPTTWSSTTTATTGQIVNLYWTHNATDASRLKDSNVQVWLDSVESGTAIVDDNITYKYEDEDEVEKTCVYEFDTSDVPDGSKVLWRVRTCGVTDEYSDWSVLRTIDIYEPPTLNVEMQDASGNDISTLTSFPFYLVTETTPETQTPLSYHISIISTEGYETTDAIGNPRYVNAGDAVYDKYFDTSDPLTLEISAGHVDLENNVTYKLRGMVAMDSGLSTEDEDEFNVTWTDLVYAPNAEIGIDEEHWYAIIRPYCEDEDGNAIENVTLSVYRREFDGGFVLIESDIPNGNDTFVLDPHPALDYARYRIVARDESTGAISYTDLPGYPVGCVSAIIQWDETWRKFDTTAEEAMEDSVWSGSMLKLPYNIDISDSNSQDVALIEYIGRENPVTYHGTQQGSVSTWNMVIPHNDIETLYGVRILQKYMGDVYVREPSGTGYWANVKVAYSKKHNELTIPISLSITRVEGGI